MYNQDPEIVRWGLHHLQGEFCRIAYDETTNQSNIDINQAECRNESTGTIDSTVVENEEEIAPDIHEELSQVDLAEASRTSPASEKHLQASVLAQDWLCPPFNKLIAENEDGYEAVDDVEQSSSGSSPGEKIYEGESWPLELTELTENFSSLDGKVRKRLNQMVSIPHVPRINGEIPSVDEATSDHDRLLERLKLYDLVELKVQGDGNCQFRAVSDQLYHTPKHHKFVRHEVVNQLKSHPEMYEGYVSMAYEEYLKKMSKSGEWGDHVTLQAAADSHGAKIFVLTSFKDTCYIDIIPAIEKSKRVMRRCDRGEVRGSIACLYGGAQLRVIQMHWVKHLLTAVASFRGKLGDVFGPLRERRSRLRALFDCRCILSREARRCLRPAA